MSVPAVYEGDVIQPSHVSQAVSFPAKDFFNVVRDLVHKVTYHTEGDRLAALTAIDGYEKHVIPAADASAVVSEDHRAPVEDVAARAPASSQLAAATAGQQIDYARLAAAIVAAQQAQAASASSEVHTVTDVAPRYEGPNGG